MKNLLKGAGIVLLLSGGSALANDSVLAEIAKPQQWAIQTGDYANTRYSTLDKINKDNVKDLRVAWTFSTGVLRGHEGSPLVIGEDVTIGHKVMLHGCRIGNRVLVGMDSTIMDDVVIEDDVMIGACSLVPPRKRLQSGYLYVGVPVKQVRPLTEEEKAFLVYSAQHYMRVAANHKKSAGMAAG